VPKSFPALRRDLPISRQETADGPVLVVKEPASGQFFRLGQAEQFIVEQLDGTRSLEDIRRRVEEQLGASLSEGTLAAFVRRLEKTGLLESSSARARAPAKRPRVRGNLLYLRFPLFDPDRLMARLERNVGFLFTPQSLAIGGVLIAVALMITAANGPEIARDLLGLYAIAVVPLVIVLALIVVSAHELAHGVTCKHFGGEVHEVGFMLVYFQPFFYCNVSDAWLFPEKAKRLWVGFAGLYFEFVLWAVATLTWRAAEAGTVVSYVALTVMAISGLKSIFDLNPFIKLDGYYILSDWLGIPNLRRRAFRYVGDGIKRILGVGQGIAMSVTARERKVLLVYGLIATVSSFILLAAGLRTAGSVLIENHQPAALLLLIGYAILRVARRFKRLFAQRQTVVSAEAHDGKGGGVSGSGAKVAESAPKASSPTPKPRRWRRGWTRRLVWLSALCASGVYMFVAHTQLRVIGPVTVLPEHNADVRSEVEGIIEVIPRTRRCAPGMSSHACRTRTCARRSRRPRRAFAKPARRCGSSRRDRRPNRWTSRKRISPRPTTRRNSPRTNSRG
jgi:putative peptide zinc metalloprotease protein